NATSVVGHRHRTVGVESDVDTVAMTTECLVDGVVDDLPHAVGQTAAVGGSDVHARPFTHRLKTFEDRQVPGGIVLGVVDGCGQGSHSDISCVLRAIRVQLRCV